MSADQRAQLRTMIHGEVIAVKRHASRSGLQGSWSLYVIRRTKLPSGTMPAFTEPTLVDVTELVAVATGFPTRTHFDQTCIVTSDAHPLRGLNDHTGSLEACLSNTAGRPILITIR